MKDIVDLIAYADNLVGEPAISKVMHMMADEIERLRSHLAAKTATAQPRNGALSGCETVPDPDSRVWGTPRTPQPHATPPQGSVQGEGSVPCSRTGNDPAAWAVTMGDGSVYEAFAAHQYDEAVALARKCLFGSDLPLPLEPLYRHPKPALTDAEREALEAAARIIDAYEEELDGFPSGAAATLRGLLERMKGDTHAV